jgi:hypothetical protein
MSYPRGDLQEEILRVTFPLSEFFISNDEVIRDERLDQLRKLFRFKKAPGVSDATSRMYVYKVANKQVDIRRDGASGDEVERDKSTVMMWCASCSAVRSGVLRFGVLSRTR